MLDKPVIAPILVNAQAASAMLSMSKSFFYTQIAEGKIPKALKYGKKRLWSCEILTKHVREEAEKQGVTT